MIRRSIQVTALAGVILLPRAALACPVCFGASEGALISGSNAGIAVLIAFTLVMLGGFAAFFVYLRRQSRKADAADISRAAAASGMERPC